MILSGLTKSTDHPSKGMKCRPAFRGTAAFEAIVVARLTFSRDVDDQSLNGYRNRTQLSSQDRNL